MKFYLLILMSALALSGCDKKSQVFDTAKQFAGKWIDQSPPKVSEIVLQLPSVSAEELALTAQNYVRPAPAKALPVQTVYFYSDGKAASETQFDGFYRQIFGETAEGRVLVQDFYQATQLPQTTALTLKSGADIHVFDTSMLDGRNIWFNASGHVHAVADYVNGVRQGAQVFYQNQQKVGAVMAQKMIVFHEDGNHILAVVEPDDKESDVLKTTLFRQNGSALVQSRMRGEQVLSAAAWLADGKQIRQQADFDKAKQESLPLSQRADAVLRLMNE